MRKLWYLLLIGVLLIPPFPDASAGTVHDAGLISDVHYDEFGTLYWKVNGVPYSMLEEHPNHPTWGAIIVQLEGSYGNSEHDSSDTPAYDPTNVYD